MGFGHRVYKTGDPRATILKQYCIDLAREVGDERWERTAEPIERAVTTQKLLPPNVDWPECSALPLHGPGPRPVHADLCHGPGRGLGRPCYRATRPQSLDAAPRDFYVGPPHRQVKPIERSIEARSPPGELTRCRSGCERRNLRFWLFVISGDLASLDRSASLLRRGVLLAFLVAGLGLGLRLHFVGVSRLGLGLGGSSVVGLVDIREAPGGRQVVAWHSSSTASSAAQDRRIHVVAQERQ